MKKLSENEIRVCKTLLSLFKIEGRPADELVTEGQLEIFHALVFRPSNRLIINCSTQYGKSLIVALACLIITCIQKKVVVIVAPKDEKAKIIMRYYIEHLGDAPNFYKCLEKNTRLERLRMEESKERIMLNQGGGIFVLSAQASNSNKSFEAAMGEGAEVVIQDESALLPDLTEATIFRMIAGKGKDAFYCKIGNPFYRNHFYKSWNDDNYQKIFIDYQQGLLEGRYTQQFIDEAKKKPLFDVLFESQFPPEDLMDDKGYIKLFTDEEIDKAKKAVEPFGEKRLGIDIAEGGGDSNVIGLRTANFATVLHKFRNEDTMSIAGYTVVALNTHNIDDRNIFMDTIGVGKGAFDRLREQKYQPTSVKFSEKADDDVQFANLRAECYWRFKEWIMAGGALDPNCDWSQLSHLKYKVDSSGRLLMMPKEEMRKLMIGSPDIPDSIAMTFARKINHVLMPKDEAEKRRLLKEFDFYKNRLNARNARTIR